MAYNPQWNAIGYNAGGFRITGDDALYRIRWGDGSVTDTSIDRDDDGDGVPDSANPVHFYGQDGTYDVAVVQVQSGLPAVHFKAFMYSGATNDIVIGGTRLGDIMTAGTGSDRLSGADGNDVLGGGAGHDTLIGGNGDDFLLGGDGDDALNGSAGSDLIGGEVGNDRIDGGADRDFLYGDAGVDVLLGGDGEDYLDGGAGADRLFGGAGADQFEFAPPRNDTGNALPSDPDRDRVVDYQQGSDHLSVDQWFPGGFALIASGAFTGAGGEVRFTNSGGATLVYGDVDGDKVADFSFRIDGNITLTEADFTF